MSSLDLIAFGIFTFSAVLGLMRGLTREVLSLLSWFAAFYAAKSFAPMLAPWIPGLDAPALSHAAALVVIFVAVLIAASLLAAALGGLVKVAGMGPYDSLLGGLFGAARGIFFLLMLTLLAGLTALPKTHAWQASLIHGHLEQAAVKLKPWLPAELAALIQYH
ncbi:MAG: CvpA family protein [Pseudomonadota bacterium]|nr:CvpA family protein [Pseudomonadota bacterium]